MPNTTPIFSKVGDVQWVNSATTANTTATLASGTVYTAFTADATSGGYVQRIRFRSLGTNASATVARIWINNGGSSAVADNNTLWDEITLGTTTVSQVAALATYELPLNFALPPGYKIVVTLGTTVAAGWDCIVIGGKF